MEGCYSPEYGVSPYGAYYDESSVRVMEVKLVGYERR